MTDASERAREVAAGLTPAMVAAMTKGVFQVMYGTHSVWIKASLRTADALQRRGLQEDHLLTPKGLAVRRILEERP